VKEEMPWQEMKSGWQSYLQLISEFIDTFEVFALDLCEPGWILESYLM